MSFDYTLRPGVATTTNALRLMELVGLDLDGGDGAGGGDATVPASGAPVPEASSGRAGREMKTADRPREAS